MLDAEKKQKEQEKQIVKFHKKLGVYGMPQTVINNATLNFAKSCKYGWGEIFLTEEQENDVDFMIEIFKSNKALVNEYYIPKALKDDPKFVLQYLKLKAGKERDMQSSYAMPSKLSEYDFHRMISGFGIRKNPEFLNMFAREFPECNILALIDRIVDENVVFHEEKEDFDRLASGLTKDVYISGARHFGAKFVKYMQKENPYYMEALMTGIETDGFESLACLPTESIWENRDLIVLAAKVGGAEGLRDYFLESLNPYQSRDYMCHGELHSYNYTEFEFYPLRKALIEDEALFASIPVSEEEKAKLRDEVAKETKEFYESVKPYDQRGLVPSKNGGAQVAEKPAAVQTQKKEGK